MKFPKISTSETEIRDLAKAWLAITLAFTIAVVGLDFTVSPLVFIMFGVTVGVGFLLHELSHKFVAQYYGAVAEFRSNDQMLWIAIALSFFKFIFAAPGAVIIASRVSRKQNGIIALSGSVTNLVLAVIFKLLAPIIPFSLYGISAGDYGFWINSWLAFFNMLPFLNLDGLKVMEWNKFVWFSTIATAAIFTFFL